LPVATVLPFAFGSAVSDLSFAVLEAVFVFVDPFVVEAFLGTVAAGFGTSFLRTFSLSSGL